MKFPKSCMNPAVACLLLGAVVATGASAQTSGNAPADQEEFERRVSGKSYSVVNPGSAVSWATFGVSDARTNLSFLSGGRMDFRVEGTYLGSSGEYVEVRTLYTYRRTEPHRARLEWTLTGGDSSVPEVERTIRDAAAIGDMASQVWTFGPGFGSREFTINGSVRFVQIGGEVSPPPEVRLSTSSLSVREGGSTSYTIRLGSDPDGTVTVEPRSDDPSVSVSPSRLTFTSANWRNAQTVVVNAAVDDDSTDDVATISHAVTGYGDLTAGGEVSVTVTEPEPPPEPQPQGVRLSLSALEIAEGGSRTYTVSLRDAPDGGGVVTVEPRSDDPSVTVSPSSLTFTADNWSTPQRVTVTAAQDEDTLEETATISHAVTGLGDMTDGGSVSVTVTEPEPDAATEPVPLDEQAAATVTLGTVTSSAVSNMTANIGSRFSAARTGTSLSPASRTLTLGDRYEHRFADTREESFPNTRYEARDMSLDDVLRSTGFQIALGAADGAGAHGTAQWTFWGRGDLQLFSREPERGAGYDGRLQAGYFGVDVQASERWLAGVAVSHTVADADYSVENGGAGNDGRMNVTLTSVLPYLRFTPDSATGLWLILGAGQGEIGNRRPGLRSPEEDSDITLLMTSAGARRALATGGPVDWALIGDFSAGRVETGDGTQAIAGLTVDVWRTRLGVEGSYTRELDNGGSLGWFMEAAGRHDGGEDVDDTGLELSPGVYLSGPDGRFGVEVRGRMLALSSSDNHEEYGLSATVSMLPGAGGRGLSLSVSPAWGSAPPASSSELWRDDVFHPSVSVLRKRSGMSLSSRLGYGIEAARGVATPFGELGLGDGDRPDARIGVRFSRPGSGLGAMSLELAGEWREGLEDESDRRLSATGRLRF